MTKLLLPVKTEGLETTRWEIDTCHTHTHTCIHSVCRENIYSWWGGCFHVGDQSSELTEGSVFRLRFNCRLCRRPAPRPPIPMCFSLGFLLFINWFLSLLNLFSPSECSRHCPALPHYQVSDAEAVPQWDDDEEGVQGSEVSDRHCWLHPPAADRPSERAALIGGG